jgi:hypothetical protein
MTLDGPAIPDMEVTCLREGKIWLYGERGRTAVVRTAIVPPDRNFASLRYLWHLGSAVAVPGDWTRDVYSVDQEDWTLSWREGNNWTQVPDRVQVSAFPDPNWLEGANTITYTDAAAEARTERMAWVGALVAGLGLGLVPQAVGGVSRELSRRERRPLMAPPAPGSTVPRSAAAIHHRLRWFLPRKG